MARRTQNTHGVVNLSTGEILEEITVSKGKKYYFPGGYELMGLVYISKLRKLDLPKDGYRLALLVMELATYGGYLTMSNKALGEELSITANRVSRLIAQLHKAGVLHRLDTRSVFLNPLFCFRGTPQEQTRAVDKWADLRRPMIASVRRTA